MFLGVEPSNSVHLTLTEDHSHDAQTMMPKPGPAASNASGCLLEIQSLGPIET